LRIRPESPADIGGIRHVIQRAFADARHSSGTEAAIVDALREANALTISLVAVEDERIVGHVALSPVTVQGAAGWFGLGPVAILPEHQRSGVGTQLIEKALERLQSAGASGCVVLGEPSYYGRFGFVHDPRLTYGDVPPPYFQCLSFAAPIPSGAVEYHPAFEAVDEAH
jgi:putative acetyltransferase